MTTRRQTLLERWHDWARADADRRRLPELKPLIDALHAATRQLREAPWNDDASGATTEDATRWPQSAEQPKSSSSARSGSPAPPTSVRASS